MGNILGLRVALFALTILNLNAFGWGERGHHVICEVATRLVENKDLASLLKGKGHQAGHVCNIPDIHWRSLPEQDKVGEDSHFMNPENLGYTIASVPTTFADIATEKGKTLTQVGTELGSLWWRADQFFRLAKENVVIAKTAPFPAKESQQDPKHPYNAAVYKTLVNMELMGHFVGDASMPYHNTADYDGWDKGRGGIHSYYESQSVTAMGLDLVNAVFERASNNRNGDFKKLTSRELSAIEKVKAVSEASVAELSKLEAADEVLEPSEKASHKYAKRPPAEKGAVAFRELILTQLARSSVALASLWDQAYEEGGKASFKGYRSFQYPLAPAYTPVDYASRP